MVRLLAIVCVFAILIGLYSHWRGPRETADLAAEAAASVENGDTPLLEVTDEAEAPFEGDVTRRPKQRSIDN